MVTPKPLITSGLGDFDYHSAPVGARSKLGFPACGWVSYRKLYLR